MKFPTYSLKIEQNNSNNYYDEIRSFTDKILIASKTTLEPLVLEYQNYLATYKLEELREIEEYILELISFGVLWKSYSEIALNTKYAPYILLSRMADWRKKHQRFKPYIDLARGFLFTLFLSRKVRKIKNFEIPSLSEIDHVCSWFEATGEFKEQSLRFIRWRAFWQSMNKEYMIKSFIIIKNFTKWFEEECENTLGKYTISVNKFLIENSKSYKWREDQFSCLRTKLEYHLNMVGAELMNRAFNKDYNKSEEKVVLLPGCMRTNNNSNCKAIKFSEGLICTGCIAGCNVNKLTQMGIKNGFGVYVIPHASDLSLWSPKKNSKVKGVIASACVTTLVEGGWELKRYGVPAQCVLLDNSGCKKHWNCNDVVTELNLRELKRILNNN